MTLEEAEAEMEKKHNSHFSGTGRLSKAIAASEGTTVLVFFGCMPNAQRLCHATEPCHVMRVMRVIQSKPCAAKCKVYVTVSSVAC